MRVTTGLMVTVIALLASACSSQPRAVHRGPLPTATAPRQHQPHGVPPGAQRAVVTKHTDGDTIHLRGLGSGPLRNQDTSVRLLEIDAPESVDPNEPLQCFAKRSSDALADLLPLGATAWVTQDRDLLDRYGRTLLYLWTDQGRFVNLVLVRKGYAEAVLYPPNDRYIALMRRAESRAKAAKRGVWGACDYFGEPSG